MRLTLQPWANIVRGRLRKDAAPPLESVATRTWEIAPAEQATIPRGFCLPGQLERVRATIFSARDPFPEMYGGVPTIHGATRALLLENAWIIDGVVYARGAAHHLRPRTRRLPHVTVDVEIDSGALYGSPGGNVYFGSWLMDDCCTYALAETDGVPVDTARPISDHARDYERWLEMRPARIRRAFVRKLVVYDDLGQNGHKARRWAAMREKLAPRFVAPPHPGVFILRGTSGQRRVFRGERELADRLAQTRGLRVIDPIALDLEAVMRACAGAKMIVGVEGSGLLHGMLWLEPAGACVVLQPPNRYCALMKHLADRDGRFYACVVGREVGQDTEVDTDEVERTIDLLPSSSRG